MCCTPVAEYTVVDLWSLIVLVTTLPATLSLFALVGEVLCCLHCPYTALTPGEVTRCPSRAARLSYKSPPPHVAHPASLASSPTQPARPAPSLPLSLSACLSTFLPSYHIANRSKGGRYSGYLRYLLPSRPRHAPSLHRAQNAVVRRPRRPRQPLHRQAAANGMPDEYDVVAVAGPGSVAADVRDAATTSTQPPPAVIAQLETQGLLLEVGRIHAPGELGLVGTEQSLPRLLEQYSQWTKGGSPTSVHWLYVLDAATSNPQPPPAVIAQLRTQGLLLEVGRVHALGELGLVGTQQSLPRLLEQFAPSAGVPLYQALF
ncbi:hypothetical protein BDZ88DRAFT_484721 [Geranomyces variabilis]|nr:hypothetical protein BDZ88DRAFT_484721 [Geranomyces variabilis]